MIDIEQFLKENNEEFLADGLNNYLKHNKMLTNENLEGLLYLCGKFRYDKKYEESDWLRDILIKQGTYWFIKHPFKNGLGHSLNHLIFKAGKDGVSIEGDQNERRIFYGFNYGDSKQEFIEDKRVFGEKIKIM